MLVKASDAIYVATQQLTSIFWRREANCALFWRSIVWPTPSLLLLLLRTALSHEHTLNCAETQHSRREAHEEHAVVYGFNDHRTSSRISALTYPGGYALTRGTSGVPPHKPRATPHGPSAAAEESERRARSRAAARAVL